MLGQLIIRVLTDACIASWPWNSHWQRTVAERDEADWLAIKLFNKRFDDLTTDQRSCITELLRSRFRL